MSLNALCFAECVIRYGGNKILKYKGMFYVYKKDQKGRGDLGELNFEP